MSASRRASCAAANSSSCCSRNSRSLPVADERVRHFAKRLLHRPLLAERRLLRARLRERHLRSRAPGGEDRLRQAGGRRPDPAPPLNSAPSAVLWTPPVPVSVIVGKYAARATPISRIGRDDLLFGRLDVGPPLEQRRWQPGGHVRRVRLLGQRRARGRSARGLPPSSTLMKFSCCSICAFERRDRRRSRRRPSCSAWRTSTQRGRAALLAHAASGRSDSLPRRERAPRDVELAVERAQTEIARPPPG